MGLPITTPPEGETRPPVEPTATPAPIAEDELITKIKADPARTAEEIRTLRQENADRRKKLQQFEADQEAAEKKALEEQGKYKELAEKNAAELEDLKAKRIEDAIQSAVQLEATKLNFNDPGDAYIQADLSKTAVGEDGKVSGAAEAVGALVKAKPYLVKQTTVAQPGIGASNPSGGPALTAADLGKMSAQEIARMGQEELAAALKRT